MSLLTELKRRNVIRVALLYIVVAWLILQVADVAFGVVQLPAWSLTLVAIILALGFVPTVIFAWVFELTPEGIKREAEVDRERSVSGETGQRLNIVIAVLLLVAVGLLVYQQFGAAPDTINPLPAQDIAASVLPPDAEPSAPVLEPLPRGIAVLPFASLSGDEDNAYFASGVHEDILTQLSRLADLRVISRTSMEQIAKAELDVPAIGRRLDVSHVLEGSVRRAGDQVRVTVQLIDAATDEHVWAQNYDRSLDNIFAIQSEIASAVAGELEANLLADSVVDDDAPSIEAYDLYLRARAPLQDSYDIVMMDRSRELLEAAVSLDPNYLEAKVLLAYVCGRLVWRLADEDGRHERCARELVREIQEVWPERPETQQAIGDFRYLVELDTEGAMDAYLAALERLPNDIELLRQLMATYKRLYRYEEGYEIGLRARRLDPVGAVTLGEFYLLLIGSGRLKEAMQIYRSDHPESLEAFQNLDVRVAYQYFGDVEALLEADLEPASHVARDAAFVWAGQGEFERAHALLGPAPEESDFFSIPTFYLNKTFLHELAGETELRRQTAVETLTRLEALEQTPALSRHEWFLRVLQATAAALADRPEDYATYAALAEQASPGDLSLKYWGDFLLGSAAAFMGQVEKGWSLVRELPQEAPNILTDWELKYNGLMVRLFGDLPEYQVRMAALEAA